MKKTTAFLSALTLSIMTVLCPAENVFAEENNITPVYEYFNSNDVNGKITVDIPEDTTAEIKITFTSPEVTDEPYYIKENIQSNSTLSFNIEGRDTTDNDYRNYTLSVTVTGGKYNDTITYTDTFNVPDGNDNPDSFLDYKYTFETDDKYTGNEWDVSSENESQKIIALHLDSYQLGDVNTDGFINADDATMILVEYALLSTNQEGTFSSRQNLAANVNNDNMINADDASVILVYYSELSTGGNPSWDKLNNNSSSTTTTTTNTTASQTGSTTTTTAAPSNADYSLYADSVKILEGIRDDTVIFHNYYISDINSDGIYELITEMGTCEDDNKYEVYSVKGNEIIFAGEIKAGNSTLTQKDGKLYKDYRLEKNQTVDIISFDGKKISTKSIYENTSGKYEDYGKAIKSYEWSDMTGIEIISNNKPTTSSTTPTKTTAKTTASQKTTTTGTTTQTTASKKTTTTSITTKTTTTTSTTETTTTTTTTITTIPQKKLDDAMKKAVTAQAGLRNPQYSYIDINHDSIPELLISAEQKSGIFVKVFTFNDNEFVSTDSNGEVAYICNDNGFIQLCANAGAKVHFFYYMNTDGNLQSADKLSSYGGKYYNNDKEISKSEYDTILEKYQAMKWTEPEYKQVQLYEDCPNIQNAPEDMIYYSQAIKGTVSVESGGLNMRTGAGTDYNIIILLPENAEINILGECNGWYYIMYNDKNYGYVSADYIKIAS